MMDLRARLEGYTELNGEAYVRHTGLRAEYDRMADGPDKTRAEAELNRLRTRMASVAESARSTEAQLARLEGRVPRELSVFVLPDQIPMKPQNISLH